MKKAELIKVKPLMATDRMIKRAVSDIGVDKRIQRGYGYVAKYTEYKTYLYFRARKQGQVLEVCLFTRADLVRRERIPRYRIFLDRENECHATYECREEKWRTAKIDYLECGIWPCYVPQPEAVASDSTIKLVNGYFHTGSRTDIKQAVLDFQSACAGVRLKKKYKLETDEIDYHMNMVPELPKDFDKFIQEYGFYKAQYIFYRDKDKGYCTHCGRHVRIKTPPGHNTSGKCSNCGSRITYKSWNRQKQCDTKHTVSIIQRCRDENSLVYRQFMVYRKVRREKQYIPEQHMYEEYRVIMNERMQPCYEYEFGEYRHTGIQRWCKAGTVVRGGYGYYYTTYARSVLYHGNLKRLLSGTKLKYTPIVEIIKNNPGANWNVCGKLKDMCNYDSFPYEAFWKMGLRNFTTDRMYDKKSYTKTDYSRKKPWEVLKISKEIMNQAIKLDTTDSQLRILQRAYQAGVRLTDEQVIWIDKYLGVSDLIAYFGIQTPHRLIRFLREKVQIETCMRKDNDMLCSYADYLDMARRLGWDMRDRGIFFPQDISRAHDEAVRILNEKKDKEEAARRAKTDRKMQKNARDIRKVFHYTDDDFEIIVPDKYLDFKAEGNAQHNCVSTYYERAVEGKTIILFLRKKAEPEKPFCTVEIQNRNGAFAIIQNRIIYNAEAPQEAKEFMEKAVKEAQKTVDKLLREKQQVTVAV